MVTVVKEEDSHYRSAGSVCVELIQPWFIAAAPLFYLFNPVYPNVNAQKSIVWIQD